jgi:hypothetical protein
MGECTDLVRIMVERMQLKRNGPPVSWKRGCDQLGFLTSFSLTDRAAPPASSPRQYALGIEGQTRWLLATAKNAACPPESYLRIELQELLAT